MSLEMTDSDWQKDIPDIHLFFPDGDVSYRRYLEIKYYIRRKGLKDDDVGYYQKVRAFEFPEEFTPTDEDYRLEK